MTRSRKATLKDVAREAGVAESTASRALAGVAAVSWDTRARVVEIAERLNYSFARRPRSGFPERKGLVALVVSALRNSFYSPLIDSIHDELDVLGYDMVLIVDDLASVSASRKILSLIETAIDGIIFTPAAIGSPAVDTLVAHGIPTVLAIHSNGRGNVTVVESDNRMAGREAMLHLAELGHRRIGFLLGGKDISTSQDRFAGAQEVARTHQIEIDESLVQWGEFSHQSGYSGLVKLMGGAHRPTALICGNDVVAIGALDAAQKLGISVPRDLSIIGVDDIPMASWSMISLTTVRQSIAEIGKLSARRVVKHIEIGGNLDVAHDILPTSLVRRSTTDRPPLEPSAPLRSNQASSTVDPSIELNQG